MISNDSLGKRLNDFKNKTSEQPLENDSIEDSISGGFVPLSPVAQLFSSLTDIATIFGRTIIFGYAFKIIFELPWTFWECVCIGAATTFIFKFLLDITRKS